MIYLIEVTTDWESRFTIAAYSSKELAENNLAMFKALKPKHDFELFELELDVTAENLKNTFI